MSEQLIFKRHEIKYMITKSQLKAVKEAMEKYMIADEHGKNTILSLYFDTPNYRLVRKSLEHPIYKEKLRLRSYGTAGEDTQVFIELKKKYDSVVYKRRIGMTKHEADDYLLRGKGCADTQISREIDYFLNLYEQLRPAVLLSYEREAFYAKDNHEFRITFDDNILWRDYNLSLDSGIYGMPILEPDNILMEIKTADAIPLWFVQFLNDNHIYQTSFSKYGTAYAAICSNNMNKGDYRYA
ncbi:MAG: polyphosphate polymerase domain-containing protein [Lachnospiraceae bacterium]|nr:polyphosphate polymerase domain-containing protein [Lachnospiraceae bacterium]